MLLLAVLGGCAVPVAGAPVAAPAPGNTTAPPTTAAPSPTAPPPTAPSPTATAPACPDTGWSCAQQARFAAVAQRIAQLKAPNGYLGIVVRDRATGLTWQAGDTTHEGWTASTIKLAIATDLLVRDRSGAITLSAADRHDMDTMLNFSDEAASDRLWDRYGDDAMLARFRSVFGMSGLEFVPGFTKGTYWGFVKCTTTDLAALAGYVLGRTAPADRAYLVKALRGVAENQQWGVWAAGDAGNKDGWSFEQDSYGKHWVLDSVGFTGPGERYVVAIMDQVPPSGSEADGVHAVSDLAALAFGKSVPAKVTVPEPDG
ncbi:hypothetical protein GCM10009836_17530 [Pseudonocardia ailaonensis]|uniref:Tat pathway signal sequence n=1 Tax=Pseudonocardia ailaonensis TaxID=367279 RepID=A0ABN2MVM7_9PSEU